MFKKIVLLIMCLLSLRVMSQASVSEQQTLPMQVYLEAETFVPAGDRIQIVRRAAFDVGGGSIIDRCIEPPPEWLIAKLGSRSVRVFATCANPLSVSEWTTDSTWTHITEELLNHTDEELVRPTLTRRAILCWAIMEALGIKEMEVTGIDAHEGNTAGLLVTEKYWHAEEKTTRILRTTGLALVTKH